MTCPGNTCNLQVDFTDEIVKDFLISGLSDDDFRKDVLGWSELETKSVKDTVTFFESKEMARDALNKQVQHAGSHKVRRASGSAGTVAQRSRKLSVTNVNMR